MEHQVSLIHRCGVFKRQPQSRASVLAWLNSSRSVAVSCLKITVFLLFHSCQKQRRRNPSKCSSGTCCGQPMVFRDLAHGVPGSSMLMADHHALANEQPNMMWVAVSSSSPQTSQVASETAPRRCSCDLDWMRPLLSSHPKTSPVVAHSCARHQPCWCRRRRVGVACRLLKCRASHVHPRTDMCGRPESMSAPRAR